MSSGSRRHLFTLIAFLSAFTLSASAQFTLVKISSDNFNNSDSVHKTEVEPDSFAWGNTIVTTFHVARRPGNIGWGSADVGFSTSTDGGRTWTSGILPGLTINYQDGPYGAAADPSVAYDAKHAVWMISTLPLAGLNQNSGLIGDVAVSLSKDGLTWGNPIIIDDTHLDDKNWTTCDNTPTSPFYGHCYTEWDQAFGSGFVLMSTSTDGGQTWGPGKPTADTAGGLGGEPLVQPNGTVVVPFQNGDIFAFRSTDGGKTWGRSVSVATIEDHLDAGGIRNFDMPGAAIDGSGKVYVVWSDCRFRANCNANDIVMSTSTDGQTWTSPARIPIDPTTSTVDHFLPGIGADIATTGQNAHLTVVYYYYPVSNCGNSCQLEVGFSTSLNSGATWSGGQFLAGPMQLSWLPNSDAGPMVADYIGVSYDGHGFPFGVFPVATAPSGGQLHEDMYTTKQPLLIPASTPHFSSQNEKPVPGHHADHVHKAYYDDGGHIPIPASRRLHPDNK
jgi:hypothetical protein